ncbi:hypothetical protein [Streptomyces sp. NPDC055990]|uniref:hypothetical protein n=1 Tax=Streptomyces sp. NPDC055990 TaxID=3345672 RepID=UPI0035E02CD3
MIPEHETDLTPQQSARWQLTKLAAALVRDGVPVDMVMMDARQGCDLASGQRFPVRVLHTPENGDTE